MLITPRPRHRVATALLAAVAALATFQTSAADATPTRPAPTREARAAGVTPGDAAMGWSESAAEDVGTAPSSSAERSGALASSAFVPTGVLGIDVSSWQRSVNWAAQVRAGKKFAYVKATEGTGYKNPYFRSQYNGSYNAGMIRGAYHFATPNSSSGARQARVFVANGGGWSPDGRTLPGVLDVEYNPYGSTCYGLSKTGMIAWVKSFITEYKRLTRRDAVIYTTTSWWTQCTGNTAAFSATNPLWLARYGTTTPGTLPGGWTWATFWQYSDYPIDQNRFSSTYRRLVVLARYAG